MKDAGPPGAASNGFNENLALFTAGKCAMWVDATVAASFISNPSESKVSDKVGFAAAPDAGKGKTTGWLWAWNLAIPASSKKADKAQAFIAWATSKHYTELVAGKEGWGNVPPGTRQSLYATAEYLKAAPHGQAGALCRRAVRGHSRIPVDRHDGGPAVFRGAHRLDQRG
ncbi:extracellular solute-binding protein [Xanthomonas arboricola]|uniref:extracellular solute-binding protein n=1 Tax=Xanthomonas arboricola TaxID=56448 RepID=UPI003D18EDB3